MFLSFILLFAFSDGVGLLDNEAVPEEDPPPAYTVTS